MAKRRWRRNQRLLSAGSGNSACQRSAAVEFRAATGTSDQDKKRLPDVLEPLDSAELSATYGRGFELLRRMGFKTSDGDEASGLRKGSLATPLRAVDNGTSRRGVTGAGEEQKEEDEKDTAGAVSESPEFMKSLLRQVLATMREVGDDDEAAELQRLAFGVGFTSTSPALETIEDLSEPERCRTSKRRRGPSQSIASATVEQEALEALLQGLRGPGHFPVELTEQAQMLRWKHRWAAQLGSYEEFVERHNGESLRAVHCPKPHGPLVLPAEASSLGCDWSGRTRYTSWCRERRQGATGKTKRKWKHLEGVVFRLCGGNGSRPPRETTNAGCAAEAVAAAAAQALQPAVTPPTSDATACDRRPCDEASSVDGESGLGWVEDFVE